MLNSATNILPLESCRVNAAAEFLIVKIAHAAVRIRRLQNHHAVDALHFLKIRLRVNMSLKIDDHNNADNYEICGSKPVQGPGVVVENLVNDLWRYRSIFFEFPQRQNLRRS